MDPSFTTEQLELKEAVRRFCSEQISTERLMAWEREPRGIDSATWQAIAELGWFGLGLPVSAAGSGLGLTDVACLLQECGRSLVPLAVISSIRGGWALAHLDPRAPELQEIAAGRSSVTLALDEETARAPEAFVTRAAVADGGVYVHGAKWYVNDAAHADWQVVAAREEGGVSLLLVARENTQVEELRSFDGSRQGIVRYDVGPAQRRLSQAGAGAALLERLRREQAALALAEMIGGTEAVLDMTVSYVKEREQFGQKIGVFQAVQHQIADVATDLTAARHLAWQAITRLEAGTESSTDLASAAAFVGRAFKRATLAAHHLHGGAGFVIEHPLHYHSERAQSLCIRYTPEEPALSQVAAALLDH
jgi:alkylation response protein AidB-like acyl-CoA dehydrogenase